MVLPTNWYSFTPAKQLVVVADLERMARGLAPDVGLNATLDSAAIRAAAPNSDPHVAPGFALATDADGTPAMDGAWSSGFSVLAADYFWMSSDGWGATKASTANQACTSAASSACWAHRREPLGTVPGYDTGVGHAADGLHVGRRRQTIPHLRSLVPTVRRPVSPVAQVGRSRNPGRGSLRVPATHRAGE